MEASAGLCFVTIHYITVFDINFLLLYQTFTSYSLKCQQQSQLPLQQPFSSQVEELSYKPWLPSLSDHQLQSQVLYQLWYQRPHARLHPQFPVVFAAVAALRYCCHFVLHLHRCANYLGKTVIADDRCLHKLWILMWSIDRKIDICYIYQLYWWHYKRKW